MLAHHHAAYELLHKRLERFTRMLQALGEGDVRALHRARVASRRLREMLPVLQLDAGRGTSGSAGGCGR